ncbi:hypothetical protein PR202_gb27592 [Eleusine coracana subsp. coracana]|uniref:C2 NT-type domain-containing protein n=1 Tax=Eleusine coracana subsp. coracana TaxID=191504 RepID=A0AAV5FUQ2_ELECO|nr:hypothetical protein PR202_gb27592 [Eleusine coracana subsp. coracana]
MQLQARSSTMADDANVNSTDPILQALDALSQLNQARAYRRSTSLPLTRSGSGSAKDGSDAGAADAAVEEPRPRPRVSPRLSPTSPIWSKPNKLVDKNEKEEVEGDDSAVIIIIKPRHRLSLMLPFRSRSHKLIKKDDDEYDDEYDDDDYEDPALLKSQGFAPVTPEAGGEKRAGITSWAGPIRAIGMRRMGCLFSVEVVAAQGLPPSMNGLRLAVTVRRKETRDGAVRTLPARVRLGAADFDEVLYVRCNLYGAGGGATGRPVTFEPRPFVLALVAVDAPELDLGRSAVDLSMFAKEFTDKRVRHWDMVFPLAGKAKGGELVIKLAFQSIDDDDDGKAVSFSQQPIGEDNNTASYSFRRSSISTGRKRRVVSRKLRRSSISNMLTPKTDVSAPDLRGTNSFKLDEPELVLTPIDEVKETQQKEPTTLMAELEEEKEQECEPTDESTPVTEVDEDEEPQTESEQEPIDESTTVNEVKEDEQQNGQQLTLEPKEKEEEQTESEQEPTHEPNIVIEVKEEEEQQKEPECEQPTPTPEVKEVEQQKEPKHELIDEPILVTEVEEEQHQGPECEEPTLVAEVKEEEQESKEPTLVAEVKEEQECEQPTLVAEVKEEEQQEKLENKPTDEPTLITKVKEEKQQKELECGQKIPVIEVKEEEEEQKESEHEPTDEPTSVPEVVVVKEEEEQHKELECESENVQEDDDSLLSEFHVIDKAIKGQDMKAESKEEVDPKKGSEEEEAASLVVENETAKVVVNGLEEKPVEVAMASNMLDTVANIAKPVNGEVARSEKVTEETLQMPEQGEDKGAAMKPLRPRFKWRTVALLVPLAILNSKTLGANR